MDRTVAKLFVFLAVAAVAFSILVTPGTQFGIDIVLLKRIWIALLLTACTYATYSTFRRPPGL